VTTPVPSSRVTVASPVPSPYVTVAAHVPSPPIYVAAPRIHPRSYQLVQALALLMHPASRSASAVTVANAGVNIRTQIATVSQHLIFNQPSFAPLLDVHSLFFVLQC
jgi:hypothetical protein